MTSKNSKVPSASTLPRVSRCPGSFLLCQQAPQDPLSEEAKEGILLHRYMAYLTTGQIEEPVVTEEQKAVCLNADKQLEHLLSLERTGAPPSVHTEVFMTLGTPDNKVITGRADVVILYPGHTYVVDWKFGREAVDPVEENMQMVAYAVLANTLQETRKITVVIIQPRVRDQPAYKTYNAEELRVAKQRLEELSSLACSPDAPRHASMEACRYCNAKCLCPEARAQVEAVVSASGKDTLSEQLTAVVKAAANPTVAKPALPATLPAEKLVELYDLCKLASKVADAIEKQIKLYVEQQGGSIPGLALKAGTETRTVPEVSKAYERLSKEWNMPLAEFLNCCTVKVGELDKQAKIQLLIKDGEAGKADAVKEYLSTTLGDLLQKKQAATSLIKTKTK